MTRSQGPWAYLASQALLRSVFSPIFSRINLGDITVKHAITGDLIRLHSFKHRGFWFHGKRRERGVTEAWIQWIKSGDVVIEVGAHIGYLTILLSRLVGPTGRVVALEPGSNNLPYLRWNLRGLSNASIEEYAAGEREGLVDFYVEELTGQNNSVLVDYGVFQANQEAARVYRAYEATRVRMVMLDFYCQSAELWPNWLKIDVEGYELEVLRGAVSTLSLARPALTLEITRNHSLVMNLLERHGYMLIDAETLSRVRGVPKSGNFFAFHETHHAQLINSIHLGET